MAFSISYKQAIDQPAPICLSMAIDRSSCPIERRQLGDSVRSWSLAERYRTPVRLCAFRWQRNTSMICRSRINNFPSAPVRLPRFAFPANTLPIAYFLHL